MADPKTPFWKKGIQGVFKTKNPISSTKPPARLGVVITPEKIVRVQKDSHESESRSDA